MRNRGERDHGSAGRDTGVLSGGMWMKANKSKKKKAGQGGDREGETSKIDSRKDAKWYVLSVYDRRDPFASAYAVLFVQHMLPDLPLSVASNKSLNPVDKSSYPQVRTEK